MKMEKQISIFSLLFFEQTLLSKAYITLQRKIPGASQWNIGGVGPSGVGAGVGHVHFIFFV